MGRVNVSLSDVLVKEIDEQAARERTSRSALLQRAAGEYLERARKAQEEADQRARMQDACRRMDGLAKKLGAWDPVKVIRRARDARRGAAR